MRVATRAQVSAEELPPKCLQSRVIIIRMSAIRPLAVAATDNGRLAPIGRRHRPREEREIH
jgi:hypothetical protein